jgi:hypothetical protein
MSSDRLLRTLGQLNLAKPNLSVSPTAWGMGAHYFRDSSRSAILGPRSPGSSSPLAAERPLEMRICAICSRAAHTPSGSSVVTIARRMLKQKFVSQRNSLALSSQPRLVISSHILRFVACSSASARAMVNTPRAHFPCGCDAETTPLEIVCIRHVHVVGWMGGCLRNLDDFGITNRKICERTFDVAPWIHYRLRQRSSLSVGPFF